MSTTQDTSQNGAPGASTGRRIVTQVPSLSGLVGAHPDALARIYRDGRPADPAELGDAPRGRILALARGTDLFMIARPIVKALATDALPWRGKTFDHGGNSGQNVFFGRHVLRFHTHVGPSEIDGKPTLVLSYDEPAYKNPWPFRAIRDELRSVGPGIAIGPAFFVGGGSPKVVLWFGLEGDRAAI
jgi:hypothetical protein